MSSPKEMYKKRAGTSGMSGQLYKTKLVSLVLFKLLHDERFEYFYLTSNMDEIGCFDDLWFKAKIKGVDRPVSVFIQAKHKDDPKSFVDFDEAISFHDSYSKVIQKYYSNNKSESENKIFNGKFDENECIFILYTNAKHSHESDVQFDSVYANTLNDLLATGKGGTHLLCTDKIVKIAAETILKEEIGLLAEHFTKFLMGNTNQSMQMLLDKYMLRYHVLLATSVVNISSIQSEEQMSDSKWRTLTFREDFFETNDTTFLLLKQAISKQILEQQIDKQKDKKHVEDLKTEEQLRTFFDNPCASTLGTLIGTHIKYENEALVFISQRTEDELQRLEQINLSQVIIEEAEAMAAKNILLSLELKVPVTFGNTDLITTERTMTNLTINIVNICKNFKFDSGYKIVILDENIEDGLLCVDGGLAGAVGNLLVYDEDTKLLQFTNICTFQQNNAKMILETLKSNLADLHQYRFYVKATVPFPKLSFDCSEMAKDILHKLIIYSEQSDQNKVEEVLTKQIKDNYNNNNPQNLQVRPEAIFLNYHGAVLAWWLLKNEAPYLTKETQIYQDAMNSIIHEPLMSSLKNAFNMTKMKNIEYTTHALETLQRLIKQNDETDKVTLAEKTVIVTDVATLTTIKVMQFLNYRGINNYALLDLSYTINLSSDDFCALKVELKNTNKYIIVICEKLQSGVTWYEKYLKEIAQAVEEKQKVVITDNMFVDMVLNAFSSREKANINKEINNDDIMNEQHSLVDFTQDSQINIKKNRKVIFQGQLISLNLLLDETSSSFIEGPVLNKIILNETIELGESLNDLNYDEISHLYQDRAVEYTNKSHLIPGNVCVTAVDYILGDILPCKQEDHHPDSILSIDLLEDPNNYTRPLESNNNSKDPFYIDFCFVCRLSQKSIAKGDFVQFMFFQDAQDEPYYLFSINKKDITNKIWIVKITLLDCTELFKIWQTDKKTDKDTLNTLRNLCEGVVIDNMIRNENPKIRSTSDTENIKMLNYMHNESNHTWFHMINPSKDLEEKPLITLNDSLISDNTQNKDISNLSLNTNHYYCSTASTSASNDMLGYENVASSSNRQENIQKEGTFDSGEENSAEKVMSRDFFHELCWKCAQSFYSLVPDVTVTMYNDESDNVIIKNEEDNKNIKNRTIIALPWLHNPSELVDNYVYNFHINYKYKYRLDVKTFDDIKDDIVLLTAKAGVGKSTLLSHLYTKQNKIVNNVWITKIKLVEYSGIFRYWQENKNIIIDTLETLKFVSQVIVKNKNITVDLKELSNKVYLENCSGDAWDRFNLNMFLHYYNERKLLMLFDGFDEICPDYQDEVIKLLDVVKNFPQSNKMWITSRPYNSILPDLERHFGDAFVIKHFNKNEQSQYLSNFWNKLIVIGKFNENYIDSLLEYISQIMEYLDIKLKIICYNFYNFILTKFALKVNTLLETLPQIKLFCEIIEGEYRSQDTSVFNNPVYINEFLATPLLLYLSATYFAIEILNFNLVNMSNEDVRRCISISTMYENFVQTKLRKILFEEKCGLNIDIPFINETCESELIECMATHKRLGAHAIFGSPFFKRFGIYLGKFKEMTPFKLDTEAGKKEFKICIDRIKFGKERTGLISHVTSDGVPVFIHKTFAEFFAFEYVYDIIKSKELDDETKMHLMVIVLEIGSNYTVKDYCGDPILSPNSMTSWLAAKSLVDDELEHILDLITNDCPEHIDVSKTDDDSMVRLCSLPHVKNTELTDSD